MSNIFDLVAEVIAERNECSVDDIKPEMTFEELNIDSLDTVDLLMQLEDKIGTEIELDEEVKTVGELVDFIERKTA